jgi:hypothetical protein
MVAAEIETGRTKPPPDPHYRRRFRAEIICHTVWLYDLRRQEIAHLTSSIPARLRGSRRSSAYGQTFFGFWPIEKVFGSADTNS